MKRFFLFLLPSLFSFSLHAEKLSAYFAYSVFSQPSGSPYIEAYFTVEGRTVQFVNNAGGKLQGKIEVIWVLKKDSQIVSSDKYNLLSPEMADANAQRPDFVDQKRIPASEGNYTLELTISDKNSSEQPVSVAQPVTISFPEDRISISDIELIESYNKTEKPGKFTKSGYDVVPFANNFYHEGLNTISFYAEVYNAKKFLGTDDFLVRYFLFNDGNKKITNEMVVNRKQAPQEVNVVLASFPLDKVPSGNYDIGIEVRDKKNQLLATKHILFQRSNAMREQPVVTDDYNLINITNTFVANYTNADSLQAYLDCLYPISSRLERDIEDRQIAMKSPQSMQQFLYYFWSKRDANNAEQSWLEYKQRVDKANDLYKTHNRKGYETDRGRVFLQYGAPNSIDAETMNDASYPYEIWHYYTVGKETNRKFIFYSRDRSSNNYVLLHSDVTGELSNYDWQKQLHQKTSVSSGNIDETGGTRSNFGDKSQESFDRPK
jgi:GWxTD domain-containing protein